MSVGVMEDYKLRDLRVSGFVCASWTPEAAKKRSVSRWACKNKILTNSLCNLPLAIAGINEIVLGLWPQIHVSYCAVMRRCRNGFIFSEQLQKHDITNLAPAVWNKEHVLNLKNSRAATTLRIEVEKKWLFMFTISVFFFAKTVGASKKSFFLWITTDELEGVSKKISVVEGREDFNSEKDTVACRRRGSRFTSNTIRRKTQRDGCWLS
jgi:hypothetical protein